MGSPLTIHTPYHVTLLSLTPISDNYPLLSSLAIINLTLNDIKDAANTILFTSPCPSPSLLPPPLPPTVLPSLLPPALPSLFVVKDANALIEGVKPVKTSVLTPDIALVLPPYLSSPRIQTTTRP
ncbi:hypothetical protein EDB85DRAFT_2146098 [Lactarius pseudohatsudake]|nr:hypothetical protein EDB85DRAFT_2146098 [Lactarius pseudohatsudake]